MSSLLSALNAGQSVFKEGIDVFSVTAGTYNNNESRDHSISADITGNTLTIEGLRTTDNGPLTKTKNEERRTKAKVSSNSLGLRQQPWSTAIANSLGQLSTLNFKTTLNSKL